MLRTLTPIDKIRDTIEAQRQSVREDLRAHVGEMEPYEFEHLVRDLLERISFTDCEVTQRTRDGGIDIRANFSIGISEIRTIGQVKRQRASVGQEPASRQSVERRTPRLPGQSLWEIAEQ